MSLASCTLLPLQDFLEIRIIIVYRSLHESSQKGFSQFEETAGIAFDQNLICALKHKTADRLGHPIFIIAGHNMIGYSLQVRYGIAHGYPCAYQL